MAHVRPLRVNLPTRGLRQSFTQVLQTEVEKPLTIRFTAANTRTGGFFRQVFGCVVALAALWAVREGDDPVLVVMPADHDIADGAAFRDAVARAARRVGQQQTH